MLWPVCSLVIVTVTLETARPWESLTVPRISPVFIWACAAVAPMSNKTPVARHPATSLIFVIILSCPLVRDSATSPVQSQPTTNRSRSEEHTSELQSLRHLVCRLLLE